ncbi:MAG: MFS transporter, partial [Dongiaceae bacterium]
MKAELEEPSGIQRGCLVRAAGRAWRTDSPSAQTGAIIGSVTARAGRASASGLRALIVTQALGAFNDNVLKTVVSLIVVDRALGSSGGSASLSLSSVAFVLPYLLFSGCAGYLADRFSKHRLLFMATLAEVVIVLAAVAALWLDRTDLMIAALFLMAAQSTFFSPAKYGILPEILAPSELSRANGLIESTRYLAVILGTATGGVLLAALGHRVTLIGTVLIGTAMIGALASLWITRVPPSGQAGPFRLNPWQGLRLGMCRVLDNRPVAFAVAGITCLEFTGCLVLLDMILVAKAVMGLDDHQVGMLGACVGLGAGIGSYGSGRLSGRRARPAISFLGAIGVALALMALSAVADLRAVATALFAVGLFGGAAVVPFYALLQHKAGAQEKG